MTSTAQAAGTNPTMSVPPFGRLRRASRRPGCPPGVLAVVAISLAVTASIHWHLAGADPRPWINETVAFRTDAVAAAVLAATAVVHPRRWSLVLAGLVGLGSLVAVVLYAVTDPGQIGPIADMYEPTWDPAKVVSAVADGCAAVSAGLAVVLMHGQSRQPLAAPLGVRH